ncbi:MAG: CRISPR system precrRNA processing endoribonuclease RAMP protein Cas6 [Bryobacteraceae bacterium]
MEIGTQEKAGTAVLPGRLPVGRYRLEFRAERAYEIRGYRGSAWRGLLGHALKKLVCITRDLRCADCLIYRSCVYPYVFETPEERGTAPASVAEAAPHPYVLAVAPLWQRRTVLGETVEVTLIGEGNRAAVYVLHALREGAARGIGAERVALRLERIEQQERAGGEWRRALLEGGLLDLREAATPAPPPMPEVARVRLLTPLRIRRENDLVAPERMGFDELAAAVLRRLALLTRFHTAQMWRMDHARLRAAAAEARILERRLHWQDWARYSNRQGKKIPMGGVMGEFVVETRGLEELWPLLWVGQWVHAGKGAVMGLGRFEVEGA